VIGAAACEGSPSPLDPHGTQAQSAANLWWLMLAIAGAIYALVMGMLAFALTRRRTDNTAAATTVPDQPPPPETTAPEASRFIMGFGVAMPGLILSILFGLTLVVLAGYAASARNTTLTIEVVGQQFWWEINYPDRGFTTANEIHIPVGQRVQLKVRSADVVHSFWIPELGGRMDAIPGRVNTTWIQADTAGDYHGVCTEFCGLQHANMALVVVAEPADKFEAWAAVQRQPAPLPQDPELLRGQQVFMSSACVYCHAIQGTNASSRLGPDLTHFASRRTIGAGMLPNTRGHLAGWVIDAQQIKPGNKMPPMYIDGDELQPLLAYLESLR
jgi:cytochrome c oxidase subunit II